MSLTDFINSQKTAKTGGIIRKISPDFSPISDDLLLNEFNNGVQIGESSGVIHLDEVFKFLRGSQNVFMGFPNEGKTEFTLFLMVCKSLKLNFSTIRIIRLANRVLSNISYQAGNSASK